MANKIATLACAAALSTGLIRPATSDAASALAHAQRVTTTNSALPSSRNPNTIFFPPGRSWSVFLKWRIGAGTLRFFRTCVGDKENSTAGSPSENTNVINFGEVNARIQDQIRDGRRCY